MNTLKRALYPSEMVGEKRAKLEGEALDLSVNLLSHNHLSSRDMGSYRKNEIFDISGGNVFLLQGGKKLGHPGGTQSVEEPVEMDRESGCLTRRRPRRRLAWEQAM